MLTSPKRCELMLHNGKALMMLSERSAMGAMHNIFIQSLNAIIRHAPNITEDKVQPFMIFALTAVRRLTDL
jgi:hypothetical protein